MYKDLNNTKLDYVIIGTSLTESILSSYLSKSGKKIVHFDVSKCYGGDCKNYNFKDLEIYYNEKNSGNLKDNYLRNINNIYSRYNEGFLEIERIRDYNLDFNPKFLFSKSKATDYLSNSKASSYLEFISMKKIYIHFNNKFISVPCTKSEIFLSEDLELTEKQKLLNFIFSVMKIKNTENDVNTTIDIKKEYELEDKIFYDILNNMNNDSNQFLKDNYSQRLHVIIKYILSNIDPNDKTIYTVDELISKIYIYLVSLQVYDNTPFLYPIYGSSEYSQSMCRLSSVYGSIFIVNENISYNVYINKEHLLNKEENKYIINVYDSNVDENFYLFTNNIIINESFIDDSRFQMKNIISECYDIKLYKTYKKFLSFSIVANNSKLRKYHEGPIYWKILKDDPLYNNEYGFIVYEYFVNSYSTPKNRSLIQIIILSDEYDDEFSNKCKEITRNYLSTYLNQIEEEIKNNLILNENQIDSDLEIKTEELCLHQFEELIRLYDYIKAESNNDLIITKNNYLDMDIDYYFNEFEKILKKFSLENLNPIELPNQETYDIDDNMDNLIDDLFSSIKDK